MQPEIRAARAADAALVLALPLEAHVLGRACSRSAGA
jgi:hypothetical protein